jgi:hypothetical protein
VAGSTKLVHLGRVFMSVRNAIILLVALSASTLLAGCGSSSSSSQTSPPPPPPPPSVIPTTLSGTYIISYSGMNINFQTGAQSPFAMLGTITADGKGTLTGLIDLNDLDLIATTGVTSGVQTGLKPTGTYTIGVDGRGTGTLTFTINGTTVSFGLDFVLISSSHGLITRFDSSGSGSGTIDLQPASVPANSFQSLSFSLFGADANGFPLASAGAITVNSAGVVTGIQDFNENGYSTGLSGVPLSTATSTLTEVNGGGLNGTAELDTSFGLLSFEVWVIDQTHLKFIESDTSGTVLYGDAFTQQTAFPAGQLVLTLGGIGGGFRPFVAGGLLTTDASGNMNGFEDFNYSGNFTHVTNVDASCTPLVAGRCQLAFTNFTNGTTNNFQFAAYPTSGGILLLEIDSFGLAQGAAYAQTATSFAASQSYGLNLSGYNGGEVDDIAQFTAGTSSISPGTLDENDQGTTFAAEEWSGSYTPSAQAPGRGSITATVSGGKTQQPTLNFEYYVIDSSTIAFIETDPGQVGVGTFQLQNVSGATPLAQSHISMVRPIIQPRASHNNCPTYGTCPAPGTVTLQWCAGNNTTASSPCNSPVVGLNTVAPAAGSWSNQIEGLDAASILLSGQKPGEEVNPNGAVGPIDGSGVGQYLEFGDNFLQAFDRTTGSPIFSTGGIAVPQPLSVPSSTSPATIFSGAPSNDCNNPSLDGIASYDRIDNVFVLTNIFNISNKSTGVNTYELCMAVSAPTGGVPASNLEGYNGQNSWNVYDYSLTPAIPVNPNGPAGSPTTLYFPDYLRFGNWPDGYYVSWDLEDSFNNYNIVGFEVCQLDKSDIIAGVLSNSPKCFTYVPNYAVGTDRSLIHTLLPADFEGTNPIPSSTSGEYFLALVNPRNPGTNQQCSASPCTSNQLAFWTWSGITSGASPTFITLPTHAFTPGCYEINQPYNTFCVPEPDPGQEIDGLGDRLAYRLAYRNMGGTTNAEYLAVAHTVQENANQRTGIRYYKILAGTTPQPVLLGDIQDSTNFLSMPSVAMDANGDLGITYTKTGTNFNPSPFFVTVDPSGSQGTPVPILSFLTNGESNGQDETDQDWGEYVSVTTDPQDDLTFWAVDEYMVTNQISECSLKHGQYTGCTWGTRIFTCQRGSGC